MVGEDAADAELRDDDVAIGRVDHLLDLGKLVSFHHEEGVGVGTDPLVRLPRQQYPFLAALVRALTDVPRPRHRPRKLIDPLVHLTKQTLVLRGTLTPNIQSSTIGHLSTSFRWRG